MNTLWKRLMLRPAIHRCLLCLLPVLILSISTPAVAGTPGGSLGKDLAQELVQSTEAPKSNKKNPSQNNGTNSTSEQLKEQATESPSGFLYTLWRFPVFQSGDEWVRLNQVLLAIGVGIIGLLLSHFLASLLSRFIQKTKRLETHVAIVLQKSIKYSLSIFVLLTAIVLAGFPLSFMTVLLGILAIGLTIGAKNTIYDYLSGLIIALEKPIRIGDCIEVDEHRGFVREISGRFTRIRRFDGIDVLIPNSNFLENEVVNWTLNDTRIRGDFKVSVVYGSPVEKVASTIRDACHENENVLDSPSPSVLLWDFGENALIFRAFFWVQEENPLALWSIVSSIRYRVVALFQEHDITIAYPQRDVHLDSRSAVEVSRAPEDGEDDKDEPQPQTNSPGDSLEEPE